MKKIDIGQTISILANIGVIAGIVFLAVEINQNQRVIEEQNSLNRASTREESGEAFNGFRAMLLQNPHLIQIWEKGREDEVLTGEEASQFQILCRYHIWMQINLLVRMELFGFSEEAAGTARGLAGTIQQSNTYRSCWDGAKGDARGRGYGDLVDRVDSLARAE